MFYSGTAHSIQKTAPDTLKVRLFVNYECGFNCDELPVVWHLGAALSSLNKVLLLVALSVRTSGPLWCLMVPVCACVCVWWCMTACPGGGSGGGGWRFGGAVQGGRWGRGWRFGRRRRAAGSKPATTVGGHGWSTGQLFYDQPWAPHPDPRVCVCVVDSHMDLS